MVPMLFLVCVVALIVSIGAAVLFDGMADAELTDPYDRKTYRDAARMALLSALIAAINVLLTGLLLF